MAFPISLDANCLSRRAFMLAGPGLTAAHIGLPLATAGVLTAQQVIERIKWGRS